MLSVLVEGGIVLEKILEDREVLPKQILRYRDYIKMLSQPV